MSIGVMEAEEEKLTITIGGGVCYDDYHDGAKGEDEGDDDYDDEDDTVSWTSASSETSGDAVFMVDIGGYYGRDPCPSSSSGSS